MLRVLTYHRIAEPAATPSLNPRLVSATPAVFERHLDILRADYEIVAMRDVLDAVRGATRLPGRAVLLTFDDAYHDFLDGAWPMLQARRLPATMFVPTAYPGTPGATFWWDRLYRCVAGTSRRELHDSRLGTLGLETAAARAASLARLQAHLKSLPHDAAMTRLEELAASLGEVPSTTRDVLSWDELRRLRDEGLTLGAHTRTHALLPRLEPRRALDEIAGSLQDLRREMGEALPVLSYPSGAHDRDSVDAARLADIELAFTQVDGHNDLRRADPLRLCRTNITRRTTPRLLRLRLQTWFTYVDRWRHREGRPNGAPPAPARVGNA